MRWWGMSEELRMRNVEFGMKEGTVITVVCAYCEDFMKEKDGRGVTGVSHGVCEPCFEKFKQKILEEKL